MQVTVIKQQLNQQRAELLARRQRMQAEDPFQDPDRLLNNAAVDADAAEQFDHQNISALMEEIDRKLVEVDRSLAKIDDGSYGRCGNCSQPIEEGRLAIDPVAEFCMTCQQKKTEVDVG